MLLINCPWCGPDETEFGFGGEGTVPPGRPLHPQRRRMGQLPVHARQPQGLHRERWVHSHGCRRWFNVERHTVNEITRVYPMGGDTESTEAAPITAEKQGSRS